MVDAPVIKRIRGLHNVVAKLLQIIFLVYNNWTDRAGLEIFIFAAMSGSILGTCLVQRTIGGRIGWP